MAEGGAEMQPAGPDGPASATEEQGSAGELARTAASGDAGALRESLVAASRADLATSEGEALRTLARAVRFLETYRAAFGAFDAAYTLADLGDGLRISALAHNETPRLRALVGGRRPA